MRTRCEAGAVTPVRFELGVARLISDQGFFDTVVAFDDTLCSAKVDTCYGATADGGVGEPLELLPGPDGERLRTAVLGFACGATATGLELAASDLTLTCEQDVDAAPGWQPGSRTIDLDATRGPGLVPVAEDASSRERQMLHAWALYRGAEDNGPYLQRYWNAAFALREDGPSDVAGAQPGNRNCRITARMSGFDRARVSLGDGAGAGGFQAAVNRAQPFFEVSVRLTDANAAWECRSVRVTDEDLAGADYDLVTRFDRVGDEPPVTFCGKAPGAGGDDSAERAPAAACQRP